MSSRDLADILLKFDLPPKRVVSLTPSYTDSLYSLGLGRSIVGVTDYCPVEETGVGLPARVGGPKTVDVDTVLKLKPELVLANYEENARQAVEAIEAEGIPVWVSFPRTVDETVAFLWGVVDLFRSQPASLSVKMIDSEVDWARQVSGDLALNRYFCPVWREKRQDGMVWWMTFNDNTYSGDLLRLVGGENVFANRQRRYPLEADLGLSAAENAGERDTRYPRVTAAEILEQQPEVILLPDEPYVFDGDAEAEVLALLAETPACLNGQVYRVDGKLITWCGTKLATALAELPPIFVKG